jgi:Leucine-rich repeat (LRR) protein
MKFINKILRYLPIVIYFGYVFLLLSILFCLHWFKKYNNQIEIIDYALCSVMLLHFIFDYKNYSIFAKSSLFTIILLTVYHFIYYNINIDNFDYYAIYIIILLSNLVYNLLVQIINPFNV